MEKVAIKEINGGDFLISKTDPNEIFTPEDFSEEQIMMKESVIEFVDREVWPNKPRFEKKRLCLNRIINEKSR